MAEERSLADRLLDYGVYAPIGIALSVAEELPKLADKGRQRAAGQIHVARVMGKLAVRQVQRRLVKAAQTPAAPHAAPATMPHPAPATTPATRQAAPPSRPEGPPATSVPTAHAVNGLNGSRAGGDSPTATPSGGRARHGAPGPVAAQELPGPPGASASERTTVVPDADSLAIPGYDTLAASQVVQRLSSLRPDELDAIARYEVATRGRRTILHRIGQLRADR